MTIVKKISPTHFRVCLTNTAKKTLRGQFEQKTSLISTQKRALLLTFAFHTFIQLQLRLCFMKNSLLAFVLLALGWQASAQQAAGFEMPYDSAAIFVPQTVLDSAAKMPIQCTANAEITIKWERIVLSMTPGCYTKVCDLFNCYLESVSTKQFPMAPGDEGYFSVYMTNPTSINCNGVVRINLWNLDMPDDILARYFLFNQTSSVNDVFQLEEVKVYPNPATEYFTIENDKVARIRMTALDGREVAAFDATQTKTFSLAGQQAGMYVLIMDDAQGKAIGVAQLDVK
jgi:hypothetical protein